MKFDWDDTFKACTNEDIWDAIDRVRKSRAKKPREERITLDIVSERGLQRVSVTIRRES